MVTSYTTGLHMIMVSNFSNTGAPTVNVSGLGTKSITKNGITATALASGDIGSGQAVDLVYDGTQFEMQSQPANAPVLISTAGLGYFWPFGPPNSVNNMAAFTGGVGRVWQFINNTPNFIVVNKLQDYINTNQGTTCTGGTCGVVLGIYNSACTSLLGHTTPYTSTGTGPTQFTMTAPVTLVPGGIYYLAAAADSTVPSLLVAYNFDGSIQSSMNTVGPRWGTITGVTGDGTNIALPATCGTISTPGVNPPSVLSEP